MLSSRPSTMKRPTNLSIQPPPPSHSAPPLITPTNPNYAGPFGYGQSPRKLPGNAVPPSPTYSTTSFASANTNSTGTKGSSGLGVGPGVEVPPPLPAKTEKRLPPPPPLTLGIDNDPRSSSYTGPSGSSGSRGSPHSHKSGKGWAGAVGVYDNKLVSSTLSHLPPLPPLSPSPSTASHPLHQSSSSLHPHVSNSSSTPRPSLSASVSNTSGHQSSGVIVFGDGTPLADHAHSHTFTLDSLPLVERTLAHSSPSSPWSLLTVHVLPLFAGSALKTPIEDLNQLCNSHIMSTSQRSPPTRVIALLSADLREFIASGMLTLKAKFETLEEAKVVSRAAEVWSFFWAQVLPYVEGVFLPFTQLRDVPASSSGSSSTYLSSLTSPIPVRALLLSGFLLHILLPLLPRLLPQIASSSSHPTLSSPTTQDLSRILQMSLVLSTQATYSAFFPSSGGSVDRDGEVRRNVHNLQEAVRWRTQQNEVETSAGEGNGSASSPPVRNAAGVGSNLQRGPSLTQSGRYRRKGWRASANVSALGFGQLNSGLNGPGGGGMEMSRQNSDNPPAGSNAQDGRWGRPRLDEEDEEDDYTPNGQGGLAPPPRVRTDAGDSLNLGSMMSGTSSSTTTATTAGTGSSTLTAGTTRGESLSSYGATPTPTASGMGQGRGQMAYGRPRRMRTGSTGSSELSMASDARAGRRV